MNQIENNEAWRTMLFIWDGYSTILRPFLIKLYNFKFGENWQERIPYDGYVGWSFKDEYRIPTDLSKADANKLLSYMVHLKKNNTNEANRFYSSANNAWNEVSDKPLLINKFSNAIRFRNYFFHANGDKIQRDFYEVTFDEVTSTVLGILKPFEGEEELRSESGESYYELAVKLCDGLRKGNVYPVKNAMDDISDIFPGIDPIVSKKMLLDNGFTFRDEQSLSVPDFNGYMSVIHNIRANYLTCEKIRSKLGVTKGKLSDDRIKHLCMQKELCKAIYGDDIIPFENQHKQQEALELLRTAASKKSGKRFIVLLASVAGVAALALVGGFVAMKLLNPANIYKNENNKAQNGDEPLSYNLSQVVWDDDYLYMDIVVDNFTDAEQVVSDPVVQISAFDGDTSVYEMKMELGEEWKISADGNKILKKVAVDDKKTREAFDDGIRDLKFDIAVIG